jgi:hypothetical protein
MIKPSLVTNVSPSAGTQMSNFSVNLHQQQIDLANTKKHFCTKKSDQLLLSDASPPLQNAQIAFALYVGVVVYGTPQDCKRRRLLFWVAVGFGFCFGVACVISTTRIT